MAQKFKYPMEFLRVTQKENVGSHIGSLAMDFGGKDTGADRLYCPCDMVVKRTRQKANGEVYLESAEPVEFADGSVDYARLICIHDGVFNVSEGQVLKQGDYFYDEGGMGSGNPKAFATHVHIEGGKGKWTSCTQFANSQGTYVIENQSHLYDLFVVGNDVVILNDGGYPWKRETDTKQEIAVNCKECEQLKAENKKLKQKVRGLERDVEGAAPYVEENAKLKAEIAQLQEKLTVAQETAEIARGQMEYDDFYIQQLKTEKSNLEADIDQLKTEISALVTEKSALKGEISRHISEMDKLAVQVVSLSLENSTLKETIISLQEQIEQYKQPKPREKNENLLIRIFDRFMEWVKGE